MSINVTRFGQKYGIFAAFLAIILFTISVITFADSKISNNIEKEVQSHDNYVSAHSVILEGFREQNENTNNLLQSIKVQQDSLRLEVKYLYKFIK